MMSMESKSKVGLLSEFRECLKLNIQEHQKYGVAAKYDEYLKEPEFEELPKMKELDVHSFYKEQMHHDIYEEDFVYAPSKFQPIGLQGQDISDKSLLLDSLFGINESILNEGKIDHVTILGQPGAGKTTILSRFARDAVNGKIPQMADEDHMVHIVNCRLFSENEHIDVPTFLFENMAHRPSDEAIKVGFEWMLNHPQKVTFIIDSLDTLPFELENNPMIIGPHASASPGTILYDIFTGKILPKCTILSSSREHAVRGYKGDLRADRLISLTGLTQESIERLVYGFLGEKKGEKVLQHFKTKCPLIMMLSENPAFLVFSLIASSGLEKSESSFIPKSLSGVMINLLVSLLHSEHQTAPGLDSEEEMISMINKLKSLSFNGMMDGKVIFREEDFTQVGLEIEKVTDLVIIIPGPSCQTLRLIEGKSNLFFAHQLVQEILAGIFIAEMDLERFEEFVKLHLGKPRFAMVRRMLIGILLDQEVHRIARSWLLQVSDDVTDTKISLLKEHLRNQFQSGLFKYELLEWVHSVNESGDVAGIIVPKEIELIYLMGIPLMVSDMYAIASVLLHCDSVKYIWMDGCSLTVQPLQVFVNVLKRENPKLVSLNIFGNGPFGDGGYSALGELVQASQIEELDISDCEITTENLKTLNLSIGNYKVNCYIFVARNARRYQFRDPL